MRRTPPHHQTQRPRPPPLPRQTLRLLRPATRAVQTLRGDCQYPGCTASARARSTPPHRGRMRWQDGARQPHPALPPPPQATSTTTTSTPAAPASIPRSQTQAGRAITTNQPHAPPPDRSRRRADERSTHNRSAHVPIRHRTGPALLRPQYVLLCRARTGRQRWRHPSCRVGSRHHDARAGFHFVEDRIADVVRRGLTHVVDLGCGVGASLCYLARLLPITGPASR